AHAMKLFVAAMGASNYTYAEACPSESLSDWITLHTNLFRFLGGVPKFVVCDNLKAAVTNPDRYDPGINSTYTEVAGHYGTAILAWRPGRGGQRTRPRLRNCSPRSITPVWENCRTSPASLRAGSVAASPLT